MNRSTQWAVGAFLLALALGVLALFYRAQAFSYRERWLAQSATLPTAASPSLPGKAPPALSVPPESSPKAPTPDLTIELGQLRARIHELEQELALKKQGETTLLPAPPPGQVSMERRVQDTSNRLEELRLTNPALYEEIQQRRKESRQRTQEAFAKKASYLLERDKSLMDEGESKRYEQMISLLSSTWKLSEKMSSDLPREERRAIAAELRENAQILEPLLMEERQRTFAEIGQNLGYTPAEAEHFALYLNELIDLTTLRNVVRGGMGPPGGGPPRGRPDS